VTPISAIVDEEPTSGQPSPVFDRAQVLMIIALIHQGFTTQTFIKVVLFNARDHGRSAGTKQLKFTKNRSISCINLRREVAGFRRYDFKSYTTNRAVKIVYRISDAVHTLIYTSVHLINFFLQQARVHEIQTNPATYCNDPDGKNYLLKLRGCALFKIAVGERP